MNMAQQCYSSLCLQVSYDIVSKCKEQCRHEHPQTFSIVYVNEFLNFLCIYFLNSPFKQFILFKIFLPCCVACGIIVPRPGIKPVRPVVKAESPSHWIAREVLWTSFFRLYVEVEFLCQIVPYGFPRDCRNLLCYQQYVTVPVFSHPCSDLVLSI